MKSCAFSCPFSLDDLFSSPHARLPISNFPKSSSKFVCLLGRGRRGCFFFYGLKKRQFCFHGGREGGRSRRISFSKQLTANT
jgi:hypothetical protein